jgi:hypothetical protein
MQVEGRSARPSRGLVAAPRTVGVEHQRDVRPDRLARRLHGRHGDLVQLDLAEALRDGGAAASRHRLGAGAAQQARIGGSRRAGPPSTGRAAARALPAMSHSAMSTPESA